MSNSFDDRHERDVEKEPSYTGRPRPIIALSGFGSVKQYISRLTSPISRCSVCERPSAGLRCATCQADDCVAVTCGCGYLSRSKGEQCSGHEDEVAA